MADPRDTLTDLFKKLPGVGPRQARRFVYTLLALPAGVRADLARSIAELDKAVAQCNACQRYFTQTSSERQICDICGDSNADTGTLLLIEKDVDLETIRKSGAYHGRYFILGGTIPILADDPTKHIRAQKLLSLVEQKEELQEIIIALSVNPEGENTAQYVKKILEPVAEKRNIKITILGRGLSTGTELEYSDADTLAHALQNRK